MLNSKIVVLAIFMCNSAFAGSSVCAGIAPNVVRIFDAISADDNSTAVIVHDETKRVLHSDADATAYTNMLGDAQESYGIVEHTHLVEYLTARCTSKMSESLAQTQ